MSSVVGEEAPSGGSSPPGVVAGREEPALRPVAPTEAVGASLRHSIKDGAAWSVMHGAGERYLQPFVILGDQSLLRLAGLAGLPGVAGAIIQCLSAEVVDKFRRRQRMFVLSAVLQALTWIPVCLAIFLPARTGYWLMLGAYVLYIGLHNYGFPAWASVMGDLVPADRRGRYFGLRNFLTGSVLIAAFVVAGWWLTFCQDRQQFALFGLSSRNFAFLTLFATAGAARCVSAWYLSRMHEPHYRPHPSDRFTLWEFIRRAPRAQFGRFVFYCTLLQAGSGLVTPYLGWYMLSQLGVSPLVYSWLWGAYLLATYGVQPVWGGLGDRVGTKRVLDIGGLGSVLTPLLLLVSDNVWYLGAVLVYDGITWAAFTMAASNYLYDIVTPPKRARCTAYYNLFVSTGVAVGAFFGGLIATYAATPTVVAGISFGHPFKLILVASVLLRLLPNVALLWTIQEYRLRAKT